MYYSQSTGGFYVAAIHGDNIPADAVEITVEQHLQLLDGQSNGKRIEGGDDGLPVLSAHPAATPAAMWGLIKAERDRRIQLGGYKVGDKWYHSDTFSRTQQMGLVLMGQTMPSGIQWKTMDGSFVEMTPALASQIFQGAAASDIAIFAAAEQHKAAMEASADPGAYDFTSGWPPVFGE